VVEAVRAHEKGAEGYVRRVHSLWGGGWR
jgi:hypothetical protein